MQVSMIHVSMMRCMYPWCMYPWCMYPWCVIVIFFVVILMILSPDPHSKRPGIGVCGLQKDHNCQFSIAKGMGDVAKPWHLTKHSSPNSIHVYHTQLSFSESELLSQFQNVSKRTKDKIQNITRDSKGFPYLLFQRKIGFEIGHDWLLLLVLPV